jgi:hypothetical protein
LPQIARLYIGSWNAVKKTFLVRDNMDGLSLPRPQPLKFFLHVQFL